MIPKIVVAATAEPLDIVECRDHLDVTPYTMDSNGGTHPHDTMILAMLAAAREHCETFTGRAFVRRTYEIALDAWPTSDVISLPMPPLIGVASINVGKESDSLMDPADYVVDTYAEVPVVKPYASWPTVVSSTNLIKVRYVAGYGDESDQEPLPQAARIAILLVLEHLYRNRGASSERAMSLLSLGVESMLRPLRVRLGMS